MAASRLDASRLNVHPPRIGHVGAIGSAFLPRKEARPGSKPRLGEQFGRCDVAPLLMIDDRQIEPVLETGEHLGLGCQTEMCVAVQDARLDVLRLMPVPPE